MKEIVSVTVDKKERDNNSEWLSEKALSTLTRIGDNVSFVRNSLLCLKLNDMAHFTGISRDVLCRLEALSSGEGAMGKGRVYPSLSTIIKFSESTGIELSELLDNNIRYDSNLQQKIMENCKDIVYDKKSVGIDIVEKLV